MIKDNGDDIFVIDGHMHNWTAGPDNWRNNYGEAWIKCFYDYHSGLSPAEYVWSFEKYCDYGEDALGNPSLRRSRKKLGRTYSNSVTYSCAKATSAGRRSCFVICRTAVYPSQTLRSCKWATLWRMVNISGCGKVLVIAITHRLTRQCFRGWG